MTKRRCLTDGKMLQTEIKNRTIEISIYTPNQTFNEIEETIIQRLHDGIEYALAPFWTEGK